MKVIAEHVQAMKEAIAPFDTEDMRGIYRANAHVANDINRRYRWDLARKARVFHLLPDGEYNDAHIYTALRSIVPTL